MIGQQTGAEQVHLFRGAVLLELIHVDAAVVVVAEHRLPVVPPDDDVMDRARIFDAEGSRHAKVISQSIHLFKPDPFGVPTIYWVYATRKMKRTPAKSELGMPQLFSDKKAANCEGAESAKKPTNEMRSPRQHAPIVAQGLLSP